MTMTRTETLSIDLLRLDGDTQSRVTPNENAVEDYAETIAAAGTEWPFGPIDVFHDGSDYWVADGFHRTLAALQVGRASIPCRLFAGTRNEARIHGMTANDRHGVRMSAEDRRKNVLWLLKTYPDMTQTMAAVKAGVSIRTMRRIVSEMSELKTSEHSTPTVPMAHSEHESSDDDEIPFDTPAPAKPDKKPETKPDSKPSREATLDAARKKKMQTLDLDDQFKLTRDLVKQLVLRAVNAVDDLARLKNSPALSQNDLQNIMSVLNAVRHQPRQIVAVKLLQHIVEGILW